MLVPVPIVCFVGTLITDIVYWRTAMMLWADMSAWLLAMGLIVSLFATLAGLIDFFGDHRIRELRSAWIHGLGNATALILSIFNACIHTRDAYTSVVPTGLILSALVVVILLITAWNGWTMVYRHGVGGARGIAREVRSLRRRRSRPSARACRLRSLANRSAPPGRPQPLSAPDPSVPAAADAYRKNRGLERRDAAVAPGLKVQAFATGLANPRSLYVLPNDDVLVVETGGPPASISRPKDLVMNWVEAKTHSSTKPGQRILLFRDTLWAACRTRKRCSSTISIRHLGSYWSETT